MPEKFTNEIFDELIKNRPIKRLENYINCSTKIKFKCLINGCEWITQPMSILRGFGCAKCSSNVKYTNETFDLKISKLNIKRLDNYVNNVTKLNFMCLECNTIFTKPPVELARKDYKGCPNCADQTLNNNIIDKRLKSKNIERIGEYVNARTKILFKCLNKNCNYVWLSTTENLRKKHKGCPACNVLNSEKETKILIKKLCKYDIFEYHKQITINDKRYIPDFYLEIGNNKIIIEYNGHQHYFPVRFAGMAQEKAEENFVKQQNRDEELRKYCKENNIILLEIPYHWKEEKIIKELNKLNDIKNNG